jgi:hypothetical protein
MPPKKKRQDAGKQAEVLAEAQRLREGREGGYRERALALFPHVCGRCGREFSGKTLRELTVHHKDHDHNNNPPDGSNWELLCLYCHDNEHEDQVQRGEYGAASAGGGTEELLGHNPFSGLKGLLGKGEEEEDSTGG